MRKIFFLVLFVLFFVSLKAQQKSILPLMAQSNDFINLIEQEYKQQVVFEQFDVIAQERTFYRTLYGNVMYGIIVFGDNDIADLKLDISHVNNGKWQSDTLAGAEKGIVMLYFKPEVTDTYAFTVSSTISQGAKYGYYACILFR